MPVAFSPDSPELTPHLPIFASSHPLLPTLASIKTKPLDGVFLKLSDVVGIKRLRKPTADGESRHRLLRMD